MRRRQAASQFSGARAAAAAGTRRCSVPTLKPMDSTLASGLPCKSDTDLSGRAGRGGKLAVLREEHRRMSAGGAGSSAGLRPVSFYGATAGGMSSSAHSLRYPAHNNGTALTAGLSGTSEIPGSSSLRLCHEALQATSSSSLSAGLGSSGPKSSQLQGLTAKCGGQTQTRLSPFQGSTIVAGAVVSGDAGGVNGVGADESGKVRN